MDNKAVAGCLGLHSRYSLDNTEVVGNTVDSMAGNKGKVGMGNSKVEKHRKVTDLPLDLLRMVKMDLRNVVLHGVVYLDYDLFEVCTLGSNT